MSTETGVQSRGGLPRHRKSHLGSGPRANTARMNMARDVIRYCKCGCGTALNSPTSQYEKGHWKPAPHEVRVCVACGRTFKVPATSVRTLCVRNRDCQGTQRAREAPGARLNNGDQKIRQRLVELRRDWTWRERKLISAKRFVYREPLRIAQREAALIAIETAARRNAWERERQTLNWIDSLSETDRVAAEELLADQKKDEKRQQIAFGRSLDERFSEDDDGSWIGAKVGGVWFDREDDQWAYFAAQHAHSSVRASTGRMRRQEKIVGWVPGS